MKRGDQFFVSTFHTGNDPVPASLITVMSRSFVAQYGDFIGELCMYINFDGVKRLETVEYIKNMYNRRVRRCSCGSMLK